MNVNFVGLRRSITWLLIWSFLLELINVDGNAYTVNAADQLTAAGSTNLSYNGAGSVSSLQNGTDFTFEYDFRDQLKHASASGMDIAYQYDGDNLRVKKTVNGQVTRYLTMGGQVIKEYDDAYQPTQAYLPGVGWRHNNDEADWNYYLTDAQGSVLSITNSNGDIVARYDYSDYGDELSATGPLADENTFRYTGEQLDKETHLYYLRNRYMSPALGRFIQRDPIRYGSGPNMMAYCSGDPTNRSDPSGLAPFSFNFPVDLDFDNNGCHSQRHIGNLYFTFNVDAQTQTVTSGTVTFKGTLDPRNFGGTVDLSLKIKGQTRFKFNFPDPGDPLKGIRVTDPALFTGADLTGQSLTGANSPVPIEFGQGADIPSIHGSKGRMTNGDLRFQVDVAGTGTFRQGRAAAQPITWASPTSNSAYRYWSFDQVPISRAPRYGAPFP